MGGVAKRPVNLHVQLGKPNSLEALQISGLDFETSQLRIIPERPCGTIFVVMDDRASIRRRPPRSLCRYLFGILFLYLIKAVCKHFAGL